MSQPEDMTAKKLEMLWRALMALATVVFLLAACGAWVYTQGVDGNISRAITRVLPFPAARVGNDWISIRDVRNAASGPQAFEQALTARIRQAVAKRLAREQGMTPSLDHIARAKESIVGNPDQYGWSQRTFDTRVVQPLALVFALEEWAAHDVVAQREPRERAQLALARLEGGDDFGSVAGDMSEDRSAIFDGDMGFLTVEELPQEWRAPLLTLHEEERTDMIETPQAFVILRLIEKVGEEEGTDVKLRVASVQIKKHSLERVLDEYMQTLKIKRYFE